MKAIMAMAENRCIGNKGKLPWPSIKKDFIWFKEFTMNKNLVVGSTTFELLPKLPNRHVYFISRPKAKSDNDIPAFDMGYYSNKNGLIGKRLPYHVCVINGIMNIDMFGNETLWKLEDPIIAGGKTIYNLFMSYITEFYVTHVSGNYDGDTYMDDFEQYFKQRELIKEFDGHRIIKYSK
jgi:dihydrofolate reductase